MEGYFQGNILEDEVRGILADAKESFLTGVLPLGTNNLPQVSAIRWGGWAWFGGDVV